MMIYLVAWCDKFTNDVESGFLNLKKAQQRRMQKQKEEPQYRWFIRMVEVEE